MQKTILGGDTILSSIRVTNELKITPIKLRQKFVWTDMSLFGHSI